MARARLAACAVVMGWALLAALPAAAQVDLIVNGDFEQITKSKDLRVDNKGQDWSETRKDGEGRKLLMLSTKSIGGNKTKKAMIKADPELNTYLTQRFAESQKKDFTVQFDIYVRQILPEYNRSALIMIGYDKDNKRGPNSTGKERFVYMGFENAAESGKINLFGREGDTSWAEKTIIAADLDLKKWYTITLNIFVKDKEYQVTVEGVTPEPVPLESFRVKGKTPKKLTHISFASWNDGAGTFYVDNVSAHTD
jgi:hypothetical protein